MIPPFRISVLALSSRFDGRGWLSRRAGLVELSVLALSSRFDGAWQDSEQQGNLLLSVLALSSRFDGRRSAAVGCPPLAFFQYSLCRVVLMVAGQPLSRAPAKRIFQYSLCRVVLMVKWNYEISVPAQDFQYSLCRVVLMVKGYEAAASETQPFSTRSVESF